MNLDTIIIDTQLSNLHSVINLCKKFQISYATSNEVKDLKNAKSIILPGVGSYKEAMKNLQKLDMISRIKDFCHSGNPVLGICLGMQLLMEESDEFGLTKGLGIIEGNVSKLDSNKVPSIPHVGWNKVFLKNGTTPFLGTDFKEDYFYFVHSFFVSPLSSLDFICETNFGEQTFCSSFGKGNIIATQFHPEKSGACGLALCTNFFNQIK